MIKKLIITVP